MVGLRPGQRLLLAIASSLEDNKSKDVPDWISEQTFVVLASCVCLILLVALCVCGKRGKKKPGDHTVHQGTADSLGHNGVANHNQDNGDGKTLGGIENGGPSSNRNSTTVSGHSRQASGGSVHNLRPTSLRELPEPPVSSAHHMRNISQSGVDGEGGPTCGGIQEESGSGDYGYHHYHEPNHHRVNNTGNGVVGIGRPISLNDGYAHLGQKPTVKPTDYDSLTDPIGTNLDTPTSEAGPANDGHYSLVRERTYDVVKDVKAQSSKIYDPYSHVRDGDDSSYAGSNYYSQEDPYNHIGDSDGVVPTGFILDGVVPPGFIRSIPQSSDIDDPYSTLADDDTGEETGNELRGAVGGVAPMRSPRKQPASVNPQNSSPGDGSDEYAVVHKSRSTPLLHEDHDGPNDDVSDVTPYSIGPPEPPRRYHMYDEDDNYAGATSASRPIKEHKYSKVTARESLASISARNALNPYEFVPDMPENTYATVEGGSGDGVVGEVVMRHNGGVTVSDTNRLSQNSDTYAEIAISGGGLTTSIISTGSTGANLSGSSAPIPPSLDSLHMMTKSQTSSEGDRLSERHLSTPEDSLMMKNLPWADESGGGSGGSSEDGYSTLKRTDQLNTSGSDPCGMQDSFELDAESGEITLVPNYQTVKDCISDSEMAEELENDPNYESVEEARSKVATLKSRQESSKQNTKSSPVHLVQFPSENGGMPSTSVVPNHALTVDVSSPRHRRHNHDYEEVDLDLSPPSSPVQPSDSNSNPSPSITSGASNVIPFMSNSIPQSLTEESGNRLAQNHLYEELVDVRSKKEGISKLSKGTSSEEKKKGTTFNDKKKSEDKKKKTDSGGKVEKKKAVYTRL